MMIKSEDIEIPFIGPLETDPLEIIFPDITKYYGENKKVDIGFHSKEAPQVILHENNMTAHCNAGAQFLVRQDDGSHVNAITLFIEVIASLDSYVENNAMKLKILDIELKSYDYESENIKVVDLDLFLKLVNWLIDVAKPMIDKLLEEKGIPIPSFDDFEFKQENLELKENFIAIGTDVIIQKMIDQLNEMSLDYIFDSYSDYISDVEIFEE